MSYIILPYMFTLWRELIIYAENETHFCTKKLNATASLCSLYLKWTCNANSVIYHISIMMYEYKYSAYFIS